MANHHNSTFGGYGPRIKLTGLCQCGVVKLHPLGKAAKGKAAAMVEPRVPGVKMKLGDLLHQLAQTVAEQASKLYEERSGHAVKVTNPGWIQEILDQVDSQGWALMFIDEMTPDIQSLFVDSGISAIQMVGYSGVDESIVQQLDQRAVDYAQNRAAELVGKRRLPDGTLIDNPNNSYTITNTMRDDLQRIVSRAVEEGWSAGTLKEKILDSFSFSSERAETIARTELAFAHSNGNVQGWKETGEVAGKRSILADTHPEWDVCDENEQEGPIPMDALFASGHYSPPYHPNCLCDLVPVFEDEMPANKVALGDLVCTPQPMANLSFLRKLWSVGR